MSTLSSIQSQQYYALSWKAMTERTKQAERSEFEEGDDEMEGHLEARSESQLLPQQGSN